MQVILWSEYLKTINDNDFIPRVICEIAPIQALPFNLVEIDNKLARCCVISNKKTLCIEFVSTPIDRDEVCGVDEITCPYCGDRVSDSREYSSSGDEVCDTCGSEYTYSRNITVSYTSNIVDANRKIEVLK